MDAAIACSTLVFRDLDLREALELIASRGFSKVELCTAPGFCPHVDLGDREAEVHRIQDHLGRLGLSVVSLLAIPGYLNMRNAQTVTGLLQRAVDVAADLGIRPLTVSSGTHVDPAHWERAVLQVKHHLSRLADYAQDRDVEVSVEAPHAASLAETVAQAAGFFDLVSDPRIKCTLDTSHVPPGEGTSLPEAVRALGVDRIDHVQLRDVAGSNRMVTPGRGHADFAGLVDELRRQGYRGSLSLELEFRGASRGVRLAELSFAKRHLERILDGAAPGTRERLAALPPVKLLRRLRTGPIEEVKRSPRLTRVAKWLRTHLPSLLPVRTYDGYWHDRWHFPRRFVTHRRHSRPLEARPAAPVRVCVCGAGYAGFIHAFGFRRLAGVDVVGVSDLNDPKSAALARRVGCRAYRSSREMIASEKPDVVAVCTQETHHFDIVRDCLEGGADVFCEKILTPTFAEARQLVDLARRHDRTLAINYNYRFMPGIRAIKRAIDGGWIGDLVLANVKVHGLSYHHALDLVSFLAGEIVAVRASYENDDALRPYGQLDWRLWDEDVLYVPSKNLAVIFEMKSGALFALTSSYLYDPMGFILAVDTLFEDGAVSLAGLNVFDVVGRLSWTAKRRPPRGSMKHRRGVFARGYEYTFYRSIESFVNARVSQRRPETPGEVALSLMRLEKAISESSVTGRRVALSGDA